MISTAALLGRATEELASRSGPGIGGLLNVTFGNVPELVIAGFALAAGVHEVVKASLVGSVLGNVLLVIGGTMLVDGRRRECWRSQYEACASYLRRGLPPGPISQPAVIVHGTADRVVPYQNAVHLARRLPQASVVTLNGAGRLCWIEQAAVVNDIIRAALSGSAK